jgi:hypothetical protein
VNQASQGGYSTPQDHEKRDPSLRGKERLRIETSEIFKRANVWLNSLHDPVRGKLDQDVTTVVLFYPEG